MDRKLIFCLCLTSAVFSPVYTELDQDVVRKNSESNRYVADKHFVEPESRSGSGRSKHITHSRTSGLESSKLFGDSEKYTEDKSVDYVNDQDKQYDTDSSSSRKTSQWGLDYDSSYKREYDDGGYDVDEGKKDSKDGSDGDIEHSKKTSSGHSYNSLANRVPDVTCSYGVKFIAHPFECTKFYQCAHSKPFLFTCPSGLYFNTHLDVCDWPSNVDCSNDYSYQSSYKTSYEPNNKPTYGKSYKSDSETSYQYNNKYKPKSTSNSHPRLMAPPKPNPVESHSMHEYTDSYEKPIYRKPTFVYEPKSQKESTQYYNNDDKVVFSQKPSSFPYPMASSYQPMTSHQFLPFSTFHFPLIPVMQSPMYHPFIPFHTSQSQSPFYKHMKPDYETSQLPDDSNDSDDKEDYDEKPSKKKEESTDETKKITSSESKAQTSSVQPVAIADDAKNSVQTVTKVIVKKSGPVQKQDIPSQSKSDNNANKRYYYYYYDDNNKNNDNKNQKDGFSKDNKNGLFNYYYVANGNSDKYKQKKLSDVYDYKEKYYYDYDNDYDYGYAPVKNSGHVQHLVSVDKNYNNRKGYKSNAKYTKDSEVTDEELGFIHFDHKGRGTKTKGKGGQGLGDIGSLLPLLLLGGANGGQQLLITSLLLSKFKPGGATSGEKSGSSGDKDDLIKKLVLLSLLTGNGNVNTPTVNVPNVQIVNGQFVNIATGQPAVVIDPVTGQQVTPAQTSINPTTGQLVVTATGNPVFLQDPTTGNLQVAIIGNALTLQGNPILPVTARRRPARRLNMGTNINNNNRFIPLAPGLTNQNTAAATGRDAVNLIFLSPLTPSSLPPPIINSDGSALIRGSLRDILGPNLANFISNVPLVPGQGLPNSVAGNKQSCNVVRSGETVPFKISPRGGRLLPSECDAIGKLLDKFVPTFLQNFVPSDAAFAGFGSSNNNNQRNSNNGNSNLQPSPTDRSNSNLAVLGSNNNVDSSRSSSDNNVFGNGNINDFINVKKDHNGCTIAVPNIVPQC